MTSRLQVGAFMIPPFSSLMAVLASDSQRVGDVCQSPSLWKPKPSSNRLGEGDGSGPSPSTVASVPEAKAGQRETQDMLKRDAGWYLGQ